MTQRVRPAPAAAATTSPEAGSAVGPVPGGRTAELQSSGLKATGPRLKVLEIFQRAHDAGGSRHLGAEDVYRALLADGADVGLATVYRVLLQFEQAGLLLRRHFDAERAVFELNEGRHHDHLLCLDCGHVEEFVDPDIERRQQRLAEARGFRLAEHTLALYGHCVRADCPRRAETAAGLRTRRPAAPIPPPAPSGGGG